MRYIFILFIGFCLISTNAKAADFLSFSIGYFDVFDDAKSIDARLEYRSAKSVVFKNLHPYLGLEVNTDASAWGGAGLLYDIDLGKNFTLTPSLGIGLYRQGNSERDLDYPLLFRSQLELSYSLESGNRVGLALSHLSNGSMGDTNPGAEVISVYWHQAISD